MTCPTPTVIETEEDYKQIKFSFSAQAICIDFKEDTLILTSKQKIFLIKNPQKNSVFDSIFNNMKSTFGIQNFDDIAYIFNFSHDNTYKKAELDYENIDNIWDPSFKFVDNITKQKLQESETKPQPVKIVVFSEISQTIDIFDQKVKYQIVVSPNEYAQIKVKGKIVVDVVFFEDEVRQIFILDEEFNAFIIVGIDDIKLDNIKNILEKAYFLNDSDELIEINKFFDITNKDKQQYIYDLIEGDFILTELFQVEDYSFCDQDDDAEEDLIKDFKENDQYYLQDLVLAVRFLKGELDNVIKIENEPEIEHIINIEVEQTPQDLLNHLKEQKINSSFIVKSNNIKEIAGQCGKQKLNKVSQFNEYVIIDIDNCQQNQETLKTDLESALKLTLSYQDSTK